MRNKKRRLFNEIKRYLIAILGILLFVSMFMNVALYREAYTFRHRNHTEQIQPNDTTTTEGLGK